MERKERRSFLVFAVVIVALFVGFYFLGCSEEVEPLDITDVYARGVEVEYDGLEHGIVIENLVATDVVYYRQADGAWRTDRVAYTVPGEYTIEFRVERQGYKELSGRAVVKIKTAVLGGIYSTPRTVICDGNDYGINIFGAAASDTITYSTDGELFGSAPVLFKEVGEHVVFFRVVREYAEYSGSGVITVLPDLGGEYVNVTNGVIILDRNSAVIGDDELSMSYGIDGSGKIGEREFSVTDGVLEFDGADYIRKQASDKVYELEINDRTLYVVGGDSVALDITFAENMGIIVVDGAEVARIDGVNYCESADTDSLHMQLSDERSEIELSLRNAQTVTEDTIYIIHDGEKHIYETDYDGVVWYLVNGEYTTTSPEFDSVGRHETQALYKKDGYLPVSLNVVIEIVQSIYGIFNNDDTVLYIYEDGAQINGQNVSLEFTAGQWLVGGAVFRIADGKLKNETTGAEYTPTECAVALAVGDTRIVLTEIPSQIIITVSSDGTTVVNKDDEEIMRVAFDGDVVVTVNGRNITAAIRNGNKVFALGMHDLSEIIIFIRVGICESE